MQEPMQHWSILIGPISSTVFTASGLCRACSHGNQGGEIQVDDFIINGILVRGELHPAIAAALGTQKGLCDFI